MNFKGIERDFKPINGPKFTMLTYSKRKKLFTHTSHRNKCDLINAELRCFVNEKNFKSEKRSKTF